MSDEREDTAIEERKITGHRHRRRRSRHRRHHRAPPGAPPGTLTPDPQAPPPVIRAIHFTDASFEELPIARPEELVTLLKRPGTLWVNVDGLGDHDTLRKLAEIFDMHRLALEDVVHVSQRPKVELYGNHAFIVTRMLRQGTAQEAEQGPDQLSGSLDTEQLSIFLGPNYVLTFQEFPGDCFTPVRERLRRPSGQIRMLGADYLVYALIDAVVDTYFPILEDYGERIEDCQVRALENPEPGLAREIHELKRELILLRRLIWPQREMLNSLIRDLDSLVQDQTKLYLRDCYDHCVRLMELVESHRDVAAGLSETYLAALTVRTNDIMRVLTIIATIFIPLSFIAGVYGMNFDPEVSPWNMPELEWYLGYPFALGLMASLALGLLYYFGRNGWIFQDWHARRAQRRRAERARETLSE